MTGLDEVVTSNLCEICLSLDVQRPFCGPEHSTSSSGINSRVCYAHARSLYDLLTSAIDKQCHLCCLILDVIRKHYILISNKKNVLDDWDYVDDLDDVSDGDEDESRLQQDLLQRYQDFFYEAEHLFEDVNDASSPILLEFVFRKPLRDELSSRCTDIAVHWTQVGGLSRMNTTVSAMSLVSSLPGQ